MLSLRPAANTRGGPNVTRPSALRPTYQVVVGKKVAKKIAADLVSSIWFMSVRSEIRGAMITAFSLSRPDDAS